MEPVRRDSYTNSRSYIERSKFARTNCKIICALHLIDWFNVKIFYGTIPEINQLYFYKLFAYLQKRRINILLYW